jgi:hypothetical protein
VFSQPERSPTKTALGVRGWVVKPWIPMPSHKFHVGESVTLVRSISRNVPGGVYEVTKQLPHNGREFEYHVKSAQEDHQRVARESELTKP